MTDVASPVDQIDTHDHVWRRVGPRDAQYGLASDEYQCELCALIWST